MKRRAAAFCLTFGFAVAASAGEKNPPRPAKVPAAPRAPQARPNQEANRPANRPGPAAVDKLLGMTPEQREKALSTLPPARRQNIERRLGEIQKLPPAQQNRVRNRLELLNSLPPQRQSEVRRSMKQFQELPDERKMQIRQQVLRMAAMPDEDRRALMNTEEFRNRYSPIEQQMMGNLLEIQPPPQL